MAVVLVFGIMVTVFGVGVLPHQFGAWQEDRDLEQHGVREVGVVIETLARSSSGEPIEVMVRAGSPSRAYDLEVEAVPDLRPGSTLELLASADHRRIEARADVDAGGEAEATVVCALLFLGMCVFFAWNARLWWRGRSPGQGDGGIDDRTEQ